MDSKQIKEYLLDNPEYIKIILEDLGCDKVKIVENKRVQSTRPNNYGNEYHDNSTSLQVKLNSNLSSTIHTDLDFNKNNDADFFDLIQYLKQCKFNKALSYICNICGLKYSYNVKDNNISDGYNFIHKFKRKKEKRKENVIEEDYLDEYYLTRFIREECSEFTNDGINRKTQDKFKVSYDVLDNRVVFPIRDELGNLLSFKGRTLEKDFKIMGIPKYIYYYPYIGERHLFGYYENYFDIISSNEIFIFESEKSIMQCDSMGINNCLAISKKRICPIQLNKLLRLGKTIVLALDKDVTIEEINMIGRQFKGLLKVEYIYDSLNLLDKKDSPSDKGLEIFNILNKECRYEFKEDKLNEI